MKKSLLGFQKQHLVEKEKVLAHNKFYWIIPYQENELENITYKLVKGEAFIKKFYSALIKLITKANRMANKFKKGLDWTRHFLIKRLRKQYQNQPNQQDIINDIQNMNDKELREFINIKDLEEMKIFLTKELIKTEQLIKP